MNQSHSIWISDPIYDLLFIFGGAFLALLVPLVLWALPSSFVITAFWIWLFCFEGTHFWATLSRTYFDKEYARRNPGVLFVSLIFFVFPLIALISSRKTENSLWMEGYAFLMFAWSLFHQTRQHYGFVSLYHRRSQGKLEYLQFYRWATYLVCFSPMVYFLLHYKLRMDFPDAYRWIQQMPYLEAVGHWFPYLLLAGSILLCVFLFFSLRTVSGTGSWIAMAYLSVCFLFYNTMFFGVTQWEPFYSNALNNTQMLLGITIMNSLFHNIQYHAIVWFYSRRRYGEAVDRHGFGMAQKLNSSFIGYVGSALVYSALFAIIFWARGEIPFLGALNQIVPLDIAYVIYFGIVGHHFYLDQKIWKVSQSRELVHYFSLKTLFSPTVGTFAKA